MKFDWCSTCEGLLRGIFTQDGDFIEDKNGVPCPDCQDSDGNPVGRKCVLSDEEVEAIRLDLWSSGFLTKEEAKILDAELNLRAAQEKARVIVDAADRGLKITIVGPPKEEGEGK